MVKLLDGENLQKYGVMPGHAFKLKLPEDGGFSFFQLPLIGDEFTGILIPLATWQELRADGLAFLDVLCLPDKDVRHSHTHRVAFWTTPRREQAG